MASIEEIVSEIRTLSNGVERAQTLAATADHQAQEITLRAAATGFTTVAVSIGRARAAIATVQGGLAMLSTAIGAATTAVVAVPHSPTPEETIAGLAAVYEGMTATRQVARAAITQLTDVQRLVTIALQGGQPGPLLEALDGVKQVLILVVRRSTGTQLAVEVAIHEVRRLGSPEEMPGAGEHNPVSPRPGTDTDNASTPTDSTSTNPETIPSWSRRPTGFQGGRPTGPRTRIAPNADDSTRRSLELENDCADVLADKGYQVHQNPSSTEIGSARRHTGDSGAGEKEPDYLIEGHVFDCYSPSTRIPVRNVWSQVRNKVDKRQTERVVINLKDWQGDPTALQRQFDQWPIDGLKEVIVVTRSGTIHEIARRD